MPRVHPHEGRRPRTSVEELVAAAHGEISGCVRLLEVHRHRARAVRQVPHGQHTRRAGGTVECRHVVQRAAAVVHMTEHQNAHVARGHGRKQFLVRCVAQRPAQGLANTLGDVAVGGEVDALGEQHAAGTVASRCPTRRVRPHRKGQGRPQDLVEVQRGAVGHHHVARARPHQRCKRIAHGLRTADPSRVVPAADQALTPLLLHRSAHRAGRRLGQRSQGIAVQIDKVLGNVELKGQVAQRIGRIEGSALVQGGGAVRHAGSRIRT